MQLSRDIFLLRHIFTYNSLFKNTHQQASHVSGLLCNMCFIQIIWII